MHCTRTDLNVLCRVASLVGDDTGARDHLVGVPVHADVHYQAGRSTVAQGKHAHTQLTSACAQKPRCAAVGP